MRSNHDKDEKGKIEIFYKVCNSILKKEVENGHLKWTISEISRDSKITRSLIYYYFGKEKELLLKVAYEFTLSKIFAVNPRSHLGLAERIKAVCHEVRQMPYLFVLYFLRKNQNSDFGAMIKKAENDFLKKLAKEYDEYSSLQILEIYLLELGAIAFDLDPKTSDKIFTKYN